MPHTNRKKKGTSAAPKKPLITHTKRKEVLDEEGWVHVIDKPSKPRSIAPPSEKDEAKELWAIAADFKLGNAYYVNRTEEELEIEYTRARKAWGQSEACRRVRILLEEKTEGEKEKIKNVVVLGLGSLQNARGEGRKASFTQLVALESILENFGRETKIPVYLQDPAFTSLDTEYLQKLEYTVLPDPEAFEHIDGNTLVYAIHCYANIYEKVGKRENAAVMICTDMEMFESSRIEKEESEANKTLQVMVDGYEKIPFPQIRSDFSDTIIYWRRDEEIPAIEETAVIGEKSEPLPTEEDVPETKPVEELVSTEEAKTEEQKIEEPKNKESTAAAKVTILVEEESIETPEAQLLAEVKAAEVKDAVEEKMSEPESTGGVKI
ncbi:hypothetical protein HYALB_00013011 [Hymenoscyphus albidus]|uniref:SRR1-like domain-containing protein n=1 Tax=Hymenoscyphus albidus TaxID=595503 RepID=A0A9N9Q9Q9_9HELO|nr:hypothetical protein HYALB_00013011 [Hymenoscyphus albidus]